MSEIRSSRDVQEETKIYFHPKQIEYLDSIFPERIIPSTAPEAELREYMGTRRVLQYLKQRMKAE